MGAAPPMQPVFSDAPASRIVAVTKSDTANLTATVNNDSLATQPIIARRLYVGGAGVVYVDVAGNSGLADCSGNTVAATATGVVTMSGTNSGDTDHIVINGTDVSFTAGLTDVLSATAAVAAINANSTINGIVTAANGGGTLAVVTITCDVPGKFGNAITLTVSGTGVTRTSGATLGTGTGATAGTGGSGNYVPLTAVAGGVLEINATKVYSTGTTATLIVAEF
jgi:hypothetical protein